jgi:hypothetical protein
MHEFKHPKYYTELRKLRNRVVQSSRTDSPQSDQAISEPSSTEQVERAPGPGPKPQATSSQASSGKHQAPSNKRQASSRKRQAP